MIPNLDLEPPPSRTHVTTDQAAERLGVSARTVRRWVSRDGLRPAGRHEGRPVYLLSDVLKAWAAATRRNSAA